ncbi:glycosyltransferase family 33 protein [Piedraia hortae CBS 480.64]|uniref:Chitobiosyldiphosphodolichol beta-mannosyltransferase n=1 Tax=Piedraia hortae CBS 480.64 TaxID=1314780 RepID=A0A6A7BRU1_9PEZI|nr:glycosyltransferase family 33 protein [Piedraia hortae CBS 480.64]
MSANSWISSWEAALSLIVTVSTAVCVFIFTLPSSYNLYQDHEYCERDWTNEDKKSARSGYSEYRRRCDDDGLWKVSCSVQVVVLGDIGRSPRMQYHALSIARHGGRVDLIGYVDSEVHPDIHANKLINVVPLPPFPFETKTGALFLICGPLKVLWQAQALYHALGYRTKPSKWLLVQNPPSLPTLAIAQITSFFRRTRLVIDWHNLGYSILALRLGPRHPFVRLSQWYEGFFSRSATAHLTVTDAMRQVLKQKWDVDAVPLHDRPAEVFKPLSSAEKCAFLQTRPELKGQSVDLATRSWRLIVSSTSWTADEDFTILLDALIKYVASRKHGEQLPRLWVVITGKGPRQEEYRYRLAQAVSAGQLDETIVVLAFLPLEEYARLLGSADLGISLHTSSSGVDLPMKVVDMFGAGLPVAGVTFRAWPELVQEGENGMGFTTADELADLLRKLFGGKGSQLARLREGALRESKRRWEDEWIAAGRILQLVP